MKRAKIIKYQELVLKTLANKIDDFYLVGGTALSLFYFQHRLSVDLDFFTKHFSISRVTEILEYLKSSLKVKTELVAQNLKTRSAKVLIYNLYFAPNGSLKIDFVEDVIDLIKNPKIVEGIKILSLEDIYIRKIYATLGTIASLDKVGQRIFVGGRTEAKDFYDLYFLSHTFIPLSTFANKYCNIIFKEGLVRWFKTYDRMNMIDGLLTLDINRKIDYREMEKHFKTEINKIIEWEIGEV